MTSTRNRRGLLEETVGSVISQSTSRWEMIVVDDASEDDTWEWLRGLTDSRVEPVRLTAHAERSVARNLGLTRAAGDHILFLDDDDILPPRALELHLEALGRHPDAVASVGSRVYFTEDGRDVPEMAVPGEILRHVWEDVLLGWSPICGITLFKTDQVRSAGGWDERYVTAGDYELWSRVAREGPVVISPQKVLRYRVHVGQWRYRNYLELMQQMREEAVDRTKGSERERGVAVLRAREALIAAQRFAGQDRHWKSIRSHLKALRLAPRVLRSPLLPFMPTVKPISLSRSIVKALIPNPLLKRMRAERDPTRTKDQTEFDVRKIPEPEPRRARRTQGLTGG